MKLFFKFKKEYINIAPIIFIVGVIPLIVFLKVINLDSGLSNYWIDQVCYDFFSYYKAKAFVLVTVVCLIILIVQRVNFNIFKEEKLKLILIIIYSISVLLSAMFSDNKQIALFGFPNQDEGMLIVICYIMTVVYCIFKIENMQQVNILIKTLIFSSIVICIIGIPQYFGYDFFTSEIGKNVISSANYSNYIESLRTNKYVFSIYSTLGNPDNVGAYLSIAFPVSVIFYIVKEGIINKLVYGIINVLMFITLLGCGARAALVAFMIVLAVIFIFLKKYMFENRIYIILMLAAFSCIYLLMNISSSHRLNDKFNMLYYGSKYNIENIVMDKNKVIIKNNLEVMSIIYYNNCLYFKDENEKDLSIKVSNNTITFVDKRYEKYKFILQQESNCIYAEIENWKATFYIKDDIFNIIGFNGKPTYIEPKKKYLFKGKERLGAGRIYIWSRTISMLKNTMFIGYGPGNFPAYFPQNDYVGKIKTWGKPDILVDKCHNMYLQIAVNDGIIALTCFIIFVWNYLRVTIIRLINLTDINSCIYDLSVLCGVIGYLINSIFNDSFIGVTPIFCVLLGIGIRINLESRIESKEYL